MEKHKNKALDKDCLCSKCIFRFQCFTQERVFSDPIYQGLFEALMAQGKSKEEALDEVTAEIKLRVSSPIPTEPILPSVPTLPGTTFQPYVQPWTSGYYSGNVSFDSNGTEYVIVNYTMHNGEEVSWVCK